LFAALSAELFAFDRERVRVLHDVGGVRERLLFELQIRLGRIAVS